MEQKTKAMAIHNHEIAEKIKKLAQLQEIKGANPFRVRAYQNAARSIKDMSKQLADAIKNGEDISKLPDIGDSMAEKIRELVETGSLKQLEKMEEEIPVDTGELMKITQLGGSRLKTLYEKMGVQNVDDLKKAAENEKIQELDGFGKKTQEKILDEIKKIEQGDSHERLKWSVAEQLTEPLLRYLKDFKAVEMVEAAGSYRRRKETVGDMDILVVSNNAKNTMEHFVKYKDVDEVVSKGETRSTVILKSGLQVDLRAMSAGQYGSALLYFTGSKEHNVAIRKIARGKGYKISEYGIFKGNKKLAGKTEEEVYKEIGMQYVMPEMRENRGEIKLAKKNKLPKLIELSDIKGDLQSHSNYSDGKYTLEEMARAAKSMGHEYFAVTDHSKRVTMAKGMDEKKLANQLEEIDKVNKKLDGIKILKSVEVDILEDGRLDLPDNILKKLDIVVCSIHYNMDLSKKKQTERVIKAMESPYFNIFAHPTGRKIGEREPYDIDMEKIFKAATERNCFMEINANPERLDLNDTLAKRAKEMGVKMAISTDAHSRDNLNYMRYGIYQARRAWLEPGDVINTRSWGELKKLMEK